MYISINHFGTNCREKLVQKYCNDEFKCNNWHLDGLDNSLSSNNVILGHEYEYLEKKSDGNINSQKEIFIQGDKCNLQGFIHYPKNLTKEIDMYDGVYNLGEIIRFYKKKPTVLKSVYKNCKDKDKLITSNIVFKNYEIGMEVLVIDPNFRLLESAESFDLVEFTGKIKDIQNDNLILECPDNPNKFTKLFLKFAAHY